MNMTETSALLALARVYDDRFPRSTDPAGERALIKAWHDLLAPLSHADCERAVKQHYLTSEWTLKPKNVWDAVRAVQVQRLTDAGLGGTGPGIDYPAELGGDLTLEREYRDAFLDYVKRGAPAPRAYELADEALGVKRAAELVGMPPAVRAQLAAGIGKSVSS